MRPLSSLPHLVPFPPVTPPPSPFVLFRILSLFFFPLLFAFFVISLCLGKPSLYPFAEGPTPQVFPAVSLLCVPFTTPTDTASLTLPVTTKCVLSPSPGNSL